MNGRTVRKRMYRARADVLWGRRAYAEVLVPASIFPEAPPALPVLPAGWYPGYWAGQWFNHADSDHATQSIRVADVSGGIKLFEDGGKANVTVLRGPSEERDGGWVDWTEACLMTFEAEDGIPLQREAKQEPYDAPWVHQYLACKDWEARNLRFNHEHPLFRKLDLCELYSKSLYFNIEPSDRVSIQFGVKYFHHHRFHRFCAALHGVCRVAKKTGIDIKVII